MFCQINRKKISILQDGEKAIINPEIPHKQKN